MEQDALFGFPARRGVMHDPGRAAPGQRGGAGIPGANGCKRSGGGSRVLFLSAVTNSPEFTSPTRGVVAIPGVRHLDVVQSRLRRLMAARTRVRVSRRRG